MALVSRWDPRKAQSNLRKHRACFEGAAAVFAEALSVTVVDPRHSSPEEQRFVTMGGFDEPETSRCGTL